MDKVSNSIPLVLKQYGLLDSFCKQRIIFNWATIVGKTIASNSHIDSIKENIVYICAYQSVWMNELNMNKKTLIKKINDFYGKALVKDIKFFMGRKRKSSLDIEEQEDYIDYASLQAIRLDEEEVSHIDYSLKKIENRALQNAIRKLRIRQKQKEKLLRSEGYKKCPSCGRIFKSKDKLCFICLTKFYRKHIISIKKILIDHPDFGYEECKEVLPCQRENFYEARRELIYYYVDRVYKGFENKEDLYMAAMLNSKKKRKDLTEADLNKIIRKEKAY